MSKCIIKECDNRGEIQGYCSLCAIKALKEIERMKSEQIEDRQTLTIKTIAWQECRERIEELESQLSKYPSWADFDFMKHDYSELKKYKEELEKKLAEIEHDYPYIRQFNPKLEGN